MVDFIDFNDVDKVLGMNQSLGQQALDSYRTGRGGAVALSPRMLQLNQGGSKTWGEWFGDLGGNYKSAFALENMLVGGAGSLWDSSVSFTPQKDFNQSQLHRNMLGSYVGYSDNFPELLSAESPEELEWVKSKILKEETHRAQLEGIGFWEGLLYYLPAGGLSPENLIPFATGLRGIGLGVRAVGGLSAARAAGLRAGIYEANALSGVGAVTMTAAGRAASRSARRRALIGAGAARSSAAGIVGLSAAEGLAGGAIAEVMLNAQQGLRTREEIIFGIIGGGVFGGILGGAGMAIGKGYRTGMQRLTGHEFMSDAVIEANTHYTRALVEQLRTRGVDVGEVLEEIKTGVLGDAMLKAQQAWEDAIQTVSGDVSAPVRALAGFENETRWFSKMLKKVSWFDPNIQVATSQSKRVGELGGFLTSNPLIVTRDGSIELEGEFTRPSIESMLHLVELDAFSRIQRVAGNFNDYKRSGGKVSRDSFNEMVSRLTRRGENFDDIDISATKEDGSFHYPGHEVLDSADIAVLKESLVKSSKEVRGFFDAIKGMAEQSGAFTSVDGQEALGNIVSYMAREYDIDAIRGNREEFARILLQGHEESVARKRADLETSRRSNQIEISDAERSIVEARRAGDAEGELYWQEQKAARIAEAQEIARTIENTVDADALRVEATIDKILGDVSVVNGGNDSTVSARIKNFTERSLDVNDSDIEDFLINDADYIMGKIIRHTLPDLFLAEYLGSAKVSALVRITEAQAKAIVLLEKARVENPSPANTLKLINEMAALRDNLNKLNLMNAFRTAPEVTRSRSDLGLVNELNEILDIQEGDIQGGLAKISELFDTTSGERTKFNTLMDKQLELNEEILVKREELRAFALELADSSMYSSAQKSLYRAFSDITGTDIEAEVSGRDVLAEEHAIDTNDLAEERVDADPDVIEARSGLGREEVAEQEIVASAPHVEPMVYVNNLASEFERVHADDLFRERLEADAARGASATPVAVGAAEEVMVEGRRAEVEAKIDSYVDRLMDSYNPRKVKVVKVGLNEYYLKGMDPDNPEDMIPFAQIHRFGERGNRTYQVRKFPDTHSTTLYAEGDIEFPTMEEYFRVVHAESMDMKSAKSNMASLKKDPERLRGWLKDTLKTMRPYNDHSGDPYLDIGVPDFIRDYITEKPSIGETPRTTITAEERQAQFETERDYIVANISAAVNGPDIKDANGNKIGVDSSKASIPRLSYLLEAASSGDPTARRELHAVARESMTWLLDSLEHRLDADGNPEVEIKITNTEGVYGGIREPSIEVRLDFRKGDQAIRDQALASLAKFAIMFDQSEFYEIRPVDSTTPELGYTYLDGSVNVHHFEWELDRDLSPAEVQDLLDKSGLYGLSVQEGKITVYQSEGVDDVEKQDEFEAAVERADRHLEGKARKLTSTIKRFGAYSGGEGPGDYGSLAVHFQAPTSPKSVGTATRIGSIVVGRRVIPPPQKPRITPEQREIQTRIANAYDEMELNNLNDRNVLQAYEELAAELLTQFESLTIKVEFYNATDAAAGGQPYAGRNPSDLMRADVNENNHLLIFRTDEAGFGPPGVTYENHPMLKPALDRYGNQITDINGEPLLVNDMLRAVHDYFAHTMGQATFGTLGEESAWYNHMIMTKSPWARWALTSETRGQNSWFNFSQANQQRRADGIPRKDLPFADQKVDLLPLEFMLTGDSGVDVSTLLLPGADSVQDSINTSPTTPKGMRLSEFYQDQHSRATNENVRPDGEHRTDLGFDATAVEQKKIDDRVEWAKTVNESQYLLGAIDELLALPALPQRVDIHEIEGTGTLPSFKRTGERIQDHVEAVGDELQDYTVKVSSNGNLLRRTPSTGNKSVKRHRVKRVHGTRVGDVREIPVNQHLSVISSNGKFRYIDELELETKEIEALQAALDSPDFAVRSDKAKKKIRKNLDLAISRKSSIENSSNGVPARTARGASSERYFPALLDNLEETVLRQSETEGKLFEVNPDYVKAVRDMRDGMTGQASRDAETRGELAGVRRSVREYEQVIERRRKAHRKATAREFTLEDSIKSIMEDYVVGGDIGIATREGAVATAIYDKIATNSDLRRSVDADLLGRATPESIARRAEDSGQALTRLINGRDMAGRARKRQYTKLSDLNKKIYKVSRIIGEAKGGQRGHAPVTYNYHSSLKNRGVFDGEKIAKGVHGLIGATHVVRRNAFRDQTSLAPHNAVVDMEYQTVIDAEGDTGKKVKLEKRRDRDKVLLSTMVSRLRNTDGFEGPELAQKASRILRNYNYLRSMGGVFISSLPDIMMGISTAGMSNYARALGKTFKGEWGERGKHRDEMALLLWAGETVLGRNRSASVFDIERPYRKSSGGSLLDKADYSLGQHANYFSQLSTTNWWNGMMKGVASVAIQSRILQVAKKKASGRRVSKGDQAFLNFIGIDNRTALDVAKIHETIADGTDNFMGHKFYFSGSERWVGTINGVSSGRVAEVQKNFQAAVHTGANSTILTPNAGVLPPEATTWWGRLFGQFRSFMAQSNETIIFSGGQRLIAAKDMNQAITVFGLTMMGTLVYSLKEALLGRNAWEDLDDEENLRILLFNGLDRGGALAAPMEMNNIIHSWLGGGGPMNKIFGVSGEAGRYRERDLWGTLAAPLSAADDLHKGLGAFFSRGLDPDNDLFKSDRKRLRRAFPYQNMWWLSAGLDAAPNLFDGDGDFFNNNYRIEERLYETIGGEPKPQ